ncbi:hypothetical protein V6N13_003324 [Hibiscus sabdariffa]
MLEVNPNVVSQHMQNNFYAGSRNNQETLAEYKEKNDAAIQNLTASMQNLEMHIGQLANALSSRPKGALPRDTEDARKTT